MGRKIGKKRKFEILRKLFCNMAAAILKIAYSLKTQISQANIELEI